MPTGMGLPTSTTANPSIKSDDAIALDLFNRGLKPDPMSFPIFAKDEGWPTFWRNFTLRSNLYQLNDLLDPTFVPVTLEAKALFTTRGNFMMVALGHCIQTIKGRQIVTKHTNAADAQAAIKELVEHYSGPGSIKKIHVHRS